MMTKRTFAITTMLATIVMLAGSSTTANAQLFETNTQVGSDLKLVLLNDLSSSISSTGLNANCGVDDGTEGEFETELDGKAAGLIALYQAVPALFGHVEITVVGFATSASVKVGPTVINNQNDLDAFVAAICAITQNEGTLTDIAEAFDVATTEIQNNPFGDIQIIDLVTDGDPTTDGCDDPTTLAECVMIARDAAIAKGYDIIVALAIGDAQTVDPDALAELTFPGNNPSPIFTAAQVSADPTILNILPDNDQAFVITVPSFEGFGEAFAAKLFEEVVCPSGTTGVFPDCVPIPVGGEFLTIDSTPLLIAGLSANMILIAPIVLGIAGASYYIVRTRMNKE